MKRDKLVLELEQIIAKRQAENRPYTAQEQVRLGEIRKATSKLTVGIVDGELTSVDKKDYTLVYHQSDAMGSYEHDIQVFIGTDGHVHLCGDPESEQVYLYPEQVKLLKKLLKGVK